jgi:iron complex transport system ATP-binding protein
MKTPPVLELDNASLKKDDSLVLDRVSLTIHEGEHTVILGPNGAGKSMLLKLLTHDERALETDNKPAVRVFGDDRWNIFELRPQLGIVSADIHQRFVGGNSEGRITGEAAVVSGFLASQGILRYGTLTPQMKQQAADALKRMGALHLARRRMDQMSSGEARRVMLARALVTSPRALVLDEPTTGLDVVARHAFMEQVRQIVRPPAGSGPAATLILITHHVEEIIPEIGRVIFISKGRIAGDGPKAQMLTESRISEVFGGPMALEEAGGYYFARGAGVVAQ